MRMKRTDLIDTQDLDRPPCWPKGSQCPNPCAAALHERITQNHVQLTGQWQGWRLAGRDLVSPDGVRLAPHRVLGIAWRQQAEARRDNAIRKAEAAKKRFGTTKVKVVIVDLADWHRERFGAIAG